MKYLEDLSREVKTIHTQVIRMNKRGSKKKKTFKKAGRRRASSVTPRNLEDDFNREAEGGGKLHQTDEVPLSQVIKDSNCFQRQPTPSAPRSTSVLDRMGRRLIEPDERLKMEAKQAAKIERERQRREDRSPHHHDEMERSHHSRSHRGRSPPHYSRQQSRQRNNEDEGESRVHGHMRNNPPPSLHDENNGHGGHNED